MKLSYTQFEGSSGSCCLDRPCLRQHYDPRMHWVGEARNVCNVGLRCDRGLVRLLQVCHLVRRNVALRVELKALNAIASPNYNLRGNQLKTTLGIVLAEIMPRVSQLEGVLVHCQGSAICSFLVATAARRHCCLCNQWIRYAGIISVGAQHV